MDSFAHERKMKGKWKENERKMKGTWKEHERKMKGKWKEHERNMKWKWKENESNEQPSGILIRSRVPQTLLTLLTLWGGGINPLWHYASVSVRTQPSESGKNRASKRAKPKPLRPLPRRKTTELRLCPKKTTSETWDCNKNAEIWWTIGGLTKHEGDIIRI